MLHITRSAYYYQALRRARWGGSLALEPLQVSASSGQTTFSPDGNDILSFSSGQTGFLPEETFLSWKSLRFGQMVKRPLKTSSPRPFAAYQTIQQIHFGSQCATECVYRYLPAKVELKKSHFGKQSFIEYALRHTPCQSELAEASSCLYFLTLEIQPFRFRDSSSI